MEYSVDSIKLLTHTEKTHYDWFRCNSVFVFVIDSWSFGRFIFY